MNLKDILLSERSQSQTLFYLCDIVKDKTVMDNRTLFAWLWVGRGCDYNWIVQGSVLGGRNLSPGCIGVYTNLCFQTHKLIPK